MGPTFLGFWCSVLIKVKWLVPCVGQQPSREGHTSSQSTGLWVGQKSLGQRGGWGGQAGTLHPKEEGELYFHPQGPRSVVREASEPTGLIQPCALQPVDSSKCGPKLETLTAAWGLLLLVSFLFFFLKSCIPMACCPDPTWLAGWPAGPGDWKGLAGRRTDTNRDQYVGNTAFQTCVFSCQVVSNSLRSYALRHTRLPCPSSYPSVCSSSCPLNHDTIQPSHPLLSSSPPAFNLSQQYNIFQWVSSSHQVVKVLELQL